MTIALTPADIKARFDNMTLVPDALVQMFIEEAACLMEGWQCDCTELMSYRYLVAALLWSEGYPMRLSLPTSPSGGTGGAGGASTANPFLWVETYKVGDVSIKYAQNNQSSTSGGPPKGAAKPPGFDNNPYFDKFWMFKRQQIPIGFVINGGGSSCGCA